MAKNPKILFEGKRGAKDWWVRVWGEGRGRNKSFIVQIWKSGQATGEPDGDWAMPAVLGLVTSIDQAMLQT